MRTIKNDKLSIEKAISKIVKIPVYMKDTRLGVEYIMKNGIKVGKFEATGTIENIYKDIIKFILSE